MQKINQTLLHILTRYDSRKIAIYTTILFFGAVILLHYKKAATNAILPAVQQTANANLGLLPGNAYVVVGNHTTESLEVYDPDATSWGDPVITYKPSAALGYSAAGSALFDGPTDYKIRSCKLWPRTTTVLAVADNNCAFLAVWDGTSPRGTKIWGKFWPSKGPNIHACELLPNGNIALASTNAKYGSWVRVYNTSAPADSNYAEFQMKQAHATLWDPQNKVLWVNGDTGGDDGKGILTALIIGGTRTAPTLTEDLTRRDTMPGRSPHDISPYYTDHNKLLVSEVDGVYIYDKIKRTFTPAPGASNRTNVKGISNQYNNSYLVETRPSPCCVTTNWYTDEFNFYNPNTGDLIKTLRKSGAQFYKGKIFCKDYN